MSTTIGRDHVVNLVIGNPHPFAVHKLATSQCNDNVPSA
jgi:hypothetical protein